MTVVAGIDPGATGAVVFIDAEQRQLLAVEDMPVDKIQMGKTVRSRVSAVSLLSILAGARGAHVFLEFPEMRPMRGRDKATGAATLRQPGAAGSFAFGASYGIAYCACMASGMILTEVRPGIWKRWIGVAGGGDASRRRATELFPNHANLFARVKDNGRSDAVLLALYGAQQITGVRAA